MAPRQNNTATPRTRPAPAIIANLVRVTFLNTLVLSLSKDELVASTGSPRAKIDRRLVRHTRFRGSYVGTRRIRAPSTRLSVDSGISRNGTKPLSLEMLMAYR